MLQHLYLFSGPFVVAVAVTLAFIGLDVHWGQVPVVMTGAAIWDFGWHARVHHSNLWTASPLVRVFGALVTAIGLSIGVVIKQTG